VSIGDTAEIFEFAKIVPLGDGVTATVGEPSEVLTWTAASPSPSSQGGGRAGTQPNARWAA
jgi:hypothetical protein